MTDIQFKGGRLPPDPTAPKLMLGPHLDTAAALAAPPAEDYLSAVTSWPMYGNDRYGDCVWAMIGHYVQSATQYAKGTQVVLPESVLLQGYTDVTGFNPHQPDTDQGTVIQDALAYWQKHGVGGDKILAYAAVNVADPNQVDAAINLFGAVLIGFDFPAVAMDQFNAGQQWSVEVNDGGIEGGHAVHVGKYDANEDRACTTWGAVQAITEPFWRTYVDEAWIVITQDWLDANGRSPDGIDLHGLGEDFAQLTGKPNPFRDPTPEPAPTPVDVDAELAAALTRWLRYPFRPKYLAEPARTWLASRL